MNEAIQNIAIFVLVIIVIMITYAFHIDKDAVFKLDFSLEETKCWKGLLALFIVLDHLWMKYNLISLSIFHESAVILVSIFFFFSGYGVSFNIRKNPNYMGFLFWKKRIGYLLLPMIFWDLIMFLWRAFEGDVNISFCNYLFGKELFNGQTWYIRELMICYIFFYFLFRKYKESKKVIAGCAAFLTLMNIILYICGYGYQWYGSNYGFLIGVCAGYQGIWSKKQNKHTLVYAGILSFLMTGILSILYKIIGKEADWNLLLTRNAMTFFATIFYICIASVLKIKSGGVIESVKLVWRYS